MKLYIMRGVPGSGKSTLCKQVADIDDFILSTDDYWIRPDGQYDFNYKLIGDAHKWNFVKFRDVLSCLVPKDRNNVFIDNTNVKLADFQKYVDFVLTHGFSDVILLEPKTAWKYEAKTCAKRNTHGVPQETIQKMLDRWESSADIKRELKERYGDKINVAIL